MSRLWRRGGRTVALFLGLIIPCSLLAGCFAGPAQIIAIDPARGSTYVPGDMPIRVVFDRPVNHQSVADHFSVSPPLEGCPDLSAAFTAGPGAPCRVVWLTGQSGFVLDHPGAIFQADTPYNFRLSAGVADVDGTVNSLDHAWQIRSAPAPVLVSATPGEGSILARDAPITLDFSEPMSASSLDTALSLSPSGTALDVLQDRGNPGDFEVVPAELLQPWAQYTLTITTVATDVSLQPLAAPVTIRFRTGQMSTGGHALVLAGPSTGATVLLAAQLTPPASGEPIPAEILDETLVCADPTGCGDVSEGQPTATLEDAALAPGARWLAIVETDETHVGPTPTLRVIDLNSDREVRDIVGAEWPAWSPNGSTLAFVAADSTVQIYVPATNSLSSLPSGPLASGRPTWTSDGVTLAFPVAASSTAPEHVELATPAVSALSAIPGLSGAVADPVASAKGDQLAVEATPAGGAPVTWIVDLASGHVPVRLPGGLSPVGFTDVGTLVAVDTAGSGGPQLVSVSIDSDDISPLIAGATSIDLNSVAVSPSGRQIAYLATGKAGTVQAIIANADGTGALPLTAFTGDTEAFSVRFGG